MYTHHLVVDGLCVGGVVVGGVVREHLVLPLRVGHLHGTALRPHAHYLQHMATFHITLAPLCAIIKKCALV